jgi:hypothetical protein
MRSEVAKPCCSPIISSSPHFMPQPCKTTGSSIIGPEGVEREQALENQKQMCDSASTVKTVVVSPSQHANTNIRAWPVDKLVSADQPVEREIEHIALGMKPKYLHHNLWAPDSNPKLTAAEWTLTAHPLPRPPPSEFENLPVNQTLEEHPDLFKIVTPKSSPQSM